MAAVRPARLLPLLVDLQPLVMGKLEAQEFPIPVVFRGQGGHATPLDANDAS